MSDLPTILAEIHATGSAAVATADRLREAAYALAPNIKPHYGRSGARSVATQIAVAAGAAAGVEVGGASKEKARIAGLFGTAPVLPGDGILGLFIADQS